MYIIKLDNLIIATFLMYDDFLAFIKYYRINKPREAFRLVVECTKPGISAPYTILNME